MKRLYRWITRHRILTAVLFDIITIPAYSWLLSELGVWKIVILLVDVFLIIFALAFADSCTARLLQKPIESYNNKCDPYPLLAETELLLKYKLKGNVEQIIKLNYCAALSAIGEYERVYELLCAMNIDKYSSTLPMNKAVYYNNLADACVNLGKLEEAQTWRAKMLQIYSDMPDNKQKKALEAMATLSKAESMFYNGEYSNSLLALENTPGLNLNEELWREMICAKAYIELGDKENAKRKLAIVIEKGNKIYAVTQAKELLLKIDGI